MSKRTNNRFVNDNKNIDSVPYRKCVHHVHSHNYATNAKQHHDIVTLAGDQIRVVDMDTSINIVIVFHILAPRGSYSMARVEARVHDIIMTLNDDFNNYSFNSNTMNNFRYKSIINQVFTSNMPKQNIYLGNRYMDLLPTKPANITFSLGEIYYYPVKHKLNLGAYDDVRDVTIEHEVIGQYILRHEAAAIHPKNFLNIWVIDMVNTSILGFSNFPWEIMGDYHGIVINRRCFFPEDYNESNFCLFKTFTHEVGHYLGLLHVPNHNSGTGIQGTTNINNDSDYVVEPFGTANEARELVPNYDPTDKTLNKNLHYEGEYNPLFMNFMDYSYDKFVTMFTNKQLQTMRHMIFKYRPKINSLVHRAKLPNPKYNPDTNTTIGVANHKSVIRNPPLVPSVETNINNPRIVAAGPLPPPNLPFQPNISQLTPNLSTNNIISAGENQVITNIQKNLPPYNQPISKPTAQSNYETMMKNFNAYNSADGYARSYPYDPYIMQQYNQNIGLFTQQQPQSGRNQPNNIYNDPRQGMQPMQSMQSYDPRYMYQPDPMMAAQYDPNYLAMKRAQKSQKKKLKKKRTQVDPLRAAESQANFDNGLIDRAFDSEINPVALNNLRQQAYSQQNEPPINNLQEVSKRKKENRLAQYANRNIPANNLEQDTNPLSGLASVSSRINNINAQLQDIKSMLPSEEQATIATKPKFNKYGQNMAPAAKTTNTIRPKNKFVRSKPAGINA